MKFIVEEIGQRIKGARKAKGWTQAQLAKKSSVATITISQYETGERRPRIDKLVAIAEALGVRVEYFMLGNDALVFNQCDHCKNSLDDTLWAPGAPHEFRIHRGVIYYYDDNSGWEGEIIHFCPWCGRPLDEI